MAESLLKDAFAHHSWATVQLIDACLPLSPEQLGTPVTGTFGPVLETVRHLVNADSSYLFVMTSGRRPAVDCASMGVLQLRETMEANGTAWLQLLDEDLDPGAVLVRRRPDGSQTQAPVSVRLAQALHHGTDHRSQVCTALTMLGVEPPDIDVWSFGALAGSVMNFPAPS